MLRQAALARICFWGQALWKGPAFNMETSEKIYLHMPCCPLALFFQLPPCCRFSHLHLSWPVLTLGCPCILECHPRYFSPWKLPMSEESSSTVVQQFTCLGGLNINFSSCRHFSIAVYLYLFYYHAINSAEHWHLQLSRHTVLTSWSCLNCYPQHWHAVEDKTTHTGKHW